MSCKFNIYLALVLFQILEARLSLRTIFRKWRLNLGSCLSLSSQSASLVITQANLVQCYASKMGFTHHIRARFCNWWPSFGQKECHACIISLCLFKIALSVNCSQIFRSNSLKTQKAIFAFPSRTLKSSNLFLIDLNKLLKGLSIWKNIIAAYAVEICWGTSFSFSLVVSIYIVRNASRSSC